MLKNIKTSGEVKKEIVDNNLTILRLQRNFLLKETDWWASSDLTINE